MIDEKKLIDDLEKWSKLDKEMSEILLLGIDTFKKMIQSQPKVNEWIPVEERLPDIPTPNDYFDNKHIELYLVDIGDRYPLRAIWNGKIFTDGFHELDVIKWMPLPKLYRKDEK